MSLFKRKKDYASLIASLNAELDEKNEAIIKLTKVVKKQDIRISDLEDSNKLLKKMLTEKEMKVVKKSVEIGELKEKVIKLQNIPLKVVK